MVEPALPTAARSREQKTVSAFLEQASPQLRSLYEALASSCSASGDDVSMKTTHYYLADRRIKNFACVQVHPQTKQLLVFLKLDPDTVNLEDGSLFGTFARSSATTRTGDLEVRIGSIDYLEVCEAADREELRRGLVTARYDGSHRRRPPLASTLAGRDTVVV